MEYENGYVYELMDKGGPTKVTEPYFREAVDENALLQRMKKAAAQDKPERRFMILVIRFCHPSCHPLRI